jgi:hypothetical protein
MLAVVEGVRILTFCFDDVKVPCEDGSYHRLAKETNTRGHRTVNHPAP